MKIKTLSKTEIGDFISLLPEDISTLNFNKAFQNFQKLIAKKNLTKVKFAVGLICPNCGERLMFKNNETLSLQYYEPPYSCTGGACWVHMCYAVHCECGRFISLPEEIYQHMMWPQPKVKTVYPHNYKIDHFNPWKGKPIFKTFLQ